MAHTGTTKPGPGVSRRAFLGGTAVAVVAFALEVTPGSKMAEALAASLPPGTTTSSVTGWIAVNSDNTVTIACGGSEMGQGIMTGLAQAAAEELMVDWAQVRTDPSAPAQSYVTGGSTGIKNNFNKMRTAGAQAREVLIAAAAAQWGVSPSACTVAAGVITNTATGATLKYADVATAAAALTPPASPTLTDPSRFRIAGTRAARTDIPSKLDGTAEFGIDVKVPGMVYAAVKNSPVIGGTVTTTPATPAGTLGVVNLGNAVAVVASNTWAAMNAAANLSVSWTNPANASKLTSSTILTDAKALMTSGTPGSPLAEQVGDAPTAYTNAAKKVEQTYQIPFLPHVYMEVLNCTASVTATSCELWVPTQAPGWVVSTATSITGLPASAITVHRTLLGGGLGRKIEQDYVAQAIKVSKAIGKPVKLIWSREEDLSHDQYRPMALMRVRMGMDASGNVTSYGMRHVSPSPLYQRGWMATTGNDNVEGAIHLPYAFPTRLVEYVRHTTTIPVGFWRSVGPSMNCFAVESAIDEAALATNTDPLAFRQRLLANEPRTLAVLNKAAEMIGWSTPVAAGVARGLAISNGFGSIVAIAVEVSQPTAGVIKVNRVACAVDCGFAVNPDQVEGQMQGGIIQGISSALWDQTTFSSGKASSKNFSNTRLARMKDTPLISVAIIQSGLDKLGGVGEVAVPPMAPALANAWAKLTGVRLRTLPMFPSAGTMSG